MTVAYKGITDVQIDSTDTPTATFSVPKLAGLAVGDVMVACIVTNGVTINDMSGWTPVTTLLSVPNPMMRAWCKVADAADVAASAFDFTTLTATYGEGIVTVWTGVDTSSPLDFAAQSYVSAAVTASFPVPAATVVTDGTRLIGGAASNTGTVTLYWTKPSGWTTLWDPHDGTGGAAQSGKSHQEAYSAERSVGSTGMVTWALNGGTRAGCAWFAGLRPAGEPPPPPPPEAAGDLVIDRW